MFKHYALDNKSVVIWTQNVQENNEYEKTTLVAQMLLSDAYNKRLQASSIFITLSEKYLPQKLRYF